MLTLLVCFFSIFFLDSFRLGIGCGCNGATDSNRAGFDEEEDDDGDGFVWPTLTLSPRFHHEVAAPPPIIYGPFFEPEYPTNISVLAGQTVLLQCRVMDLGDRVVSLL